MWESLSCLLTLLEKYDKNNPEMGTHSVARHIHQKTVQHLIDVAFININQVQDSAALLNQQSQATGHCQGLSLMQRHVTLADGGGSE